MKLELSGQIFFSKNTQISNFMKIRPLGTELSHADKMTDKTKLIVAFSQYCERAKKITFQLRLHWQYIWLIFSLIIVTQ
jgi:hypothetical protein